MHWAQQWPLGLSEWQQVLSEDLGINPPTCHGECEDDYDCGDGDHGDGDHGDDGD